MECPMEVKCQVSLLAPVYLILKHETQFLLHCKISFYAQWTFCSWRGNCSQAQGTQAPVPNISNDVMWYTLHCNVQMPLNLQWSHILRKPSLCLTYWTSWLSHSILERVGPLLFWSCCWFGAAVHCHCPLYHNSITLNLASLEKRSKSVIRFLLHNTTFAPFLSWHVVSWKWETTCVCLGLSWVLWQTALD